MKRYTKVDAGYLMVLRQNDNLLDQLEQFARDEKIPSASFTGMGFVNITFGFFDFKTKKYDPRDFKSVELVSMHGTIAWKKDTASIHAHGVVTDKTFHAFGGHILNAVVGTGSVEILITVHDQRFERRIDESIGADVLNLD
ncbi:MAG TPA: PPC domain-containing DNA-binding protein [Chryseolinea sp.]